jgi:hypothetical protein
MTSDQEREWLQRRVGYLKRDWQEGLQGIMGSPWVLPKISGAYALSDPDMASELWPDGYEAVFVHKQDSSTFTDALDKLLKLLNLEEHTPQILKDLVTISSKVCNATMTMLFHYG